MRRGPERGEARQVVRREETLARQIKLGVVPAGTVLAPKPEAIRDWETSLGYDPQNAKAAARNILDITAEDLARLAVSVQKIARAVKAGLRGLAVLPQVLPNYMSYTFWRIELNVRSATTYLSANELSAGIWFGADREP